MSESSTCWISIDVSGVRNILSPLMGDWNATPSSVILRSAPRLKTWKPPESVRMGFSQPMKRCSPPWPRTTSTPGRSQRWKVFPRMMSAPTSPSSTGLIAFTVP